MLNNFLYFLLIIVILLCVSGIGYMICLLKVHKTTIEMLEEIERDYSQNEQFYKGVFYAVNKFKEWT